MVLKLLQPPVSRRTSVIGRGLRWFAHTSAGLSGPLNRKVASHEGPSKRCGFATGNNKRQHLVGGSAAQ